MMIYDDDGDGDAVLDRKQADTAAERHLSDDARVQRR